ncbi:ABC transporter substrate-binding protein [Ornithinimicrobium murale]|uniref:ABC transporter substrate-binding protein n=1 Tax=Ornithinimicrobium murale TaxID=1050153 RepID=UPI000E0DD2E8|nr:ABC transporter substrate-binding protein [Ornithinimicrobium murale]
MTTSTPAASRASLRIALVATSALLALTACSGASGEAENSTASSGEPVAADPVVGGTIDVGIDLDITDLDPLGSNIGQQSSLVVANAVYEPLFVDGPEGEMAPGLAESLNSDDAVEWTLTLPEGLTFSDGSPLDGQAVIDHVTRAQGTESPTATLAAEVAEMEAVDATTVVFTLVAPNAAFDRYFSRNLGMIASTTATDEFGNPLGAGAFVVSGSSDGVSLTVERNDAYAGDPAHADEIVFHFLPDADSRYQSLLAGTMDLTWVQTPNHISSAQTEGYTASVANATTATAIFDVTEPPFDDVRVRQAVQAAIDREVLAEVVDQGQGGLSDGPLSSRSRYAQEISYPAYEPDRARDLLAEYGEPVSLSYTTDSSPQSMQRATAIQQMLEEVGIQMTIDAADSATWGAQLFDRDFDLIEFVTSGYGDSDTVWSLFECDSGTNFGGYCNHEVNEAIQQASGTTDEQARSELYGQAAQTIVEEAPTLFFTESPAGFLAASQVGGLPDFSDRNVISLLPGELWIDEQ